jgi:protein TonB
MIAKKNPRYDLERKRTAFFQVGLLTVGSLTLAAFAWQSPMIEKEEVQRKKPNQLFSAVEMEFLKPDEKQETKIIRMEQKEEQKESSLDVQKEVSEHSKSTSNNNQTDIKSTVLVDHGGHVKETIKIGGKLKEFELEEIVIPDKDASFVGGFAALQKFITTEMVYPQEAIELGLQGKVYLEFVVERDGSISNVRVMRGVDNILDKEAVRIIRKMPKWIPGESRATFVRSHVRLPIHFHLK